jgi:hypothetical protein
MRTLGDLRGLVRRTLGDLAAAIWGNDEVDLQLKDGYAQIANAPGVFYDWTYLENLPRGFSYTQPWEGEFVRQAGGLDVGYANFTAEFERQLLGDERLRYGPANYTSPFEATDGWLADIRASTGIPATAEVPAPVTSLVRVTWDGRGIDALEARRLSRVDSRYEITKGEVYGYIWQKDGVRTLRKVRVPAAQADTYTITGSWGLLRLATDLSTATVTGTWGVPRRIPGQHPMGPDLFGAPRRPYREGKNVRLEVMRQGRALTSATTICELPDRYAVYLRDYALSRCLARRGPGQDLQLAAHFTQRWQRHVARVTRRLQVVDAEHTFVLGGDGTPSVSRPPRPKLPWPYGSTVR